MKTLTEIESLKQVAMKRLEAEKSPAKQSPLRTRIRFYQRIILYMESAPRKEYLIETRNTINRKISQIIEYGEYLYPDDYRDKTLKWEDYLIEQGIKRLRQKLTIINFILAPMRKIKATTD